MSYKSAVLANNPMHWWRCNEQGNVSALYDSGFQPCYLWRSPVEQSSGGSTATIIGNGGGNANLGWSGPASDGGALCCAGPGFWQNRPTSGIFNDPPLTTRPANGSLECWHTCGQPSIGNVTGWQNPGQPSGFQAQFIANIGAGNFEATMWSSSATPITMGITTDALWHHSVMTWTPTGYDYYFDGSHVGSTSFAGPTSDATFPFVIGHAFYPFAEGNTSGFMSEVAIYNTTLSAGDVANHHAAAERPSTRPFFIAPGGGGASSPPVLTGLTEGTVHAGLTTTSEIILADTFAIKVDITTVPPFLGESFSDTPFYFNAGWITPITAEGSTEPIRIVGGSQLIYLPPLTTAISWNIPATEVITITELAGVFS